MPWPVRYLCYMAAPASIAFFYGLAMQEDAINEALGTDLNIVIMAFGLGYLAMHFSWFFATTSW